MCTENHYPTQEGGHIDVTSMCNFLVALCMHINTHRC